MQLVSFLTNTASKKQQLFITDMLTPGFLDIFRKYTFHLYGKFNLPQIYYVFWSFK